MTNEQISKLDNCRDKLKSLHIKIGEIQSSLKELNCHGNHNLGKEIDDIFINLRLEVNKSLNESVNKINKLITEI